MLRRPPDQFLTPENLDLIERVLSESRRPNDELADLQDRATIAVWLFQGGVREEDALRKMLK